MPAVAGLAGEAVATFAVAAGVAALMAGVPLLLAVVTAVGAADLIWLGTGTFTHAPAAHRRCPRRLHVGGATGAERGSA